MGFTDVDVTDSAALEKAIKGMGKLQGLAYCVGSINLKPLKATTTDDFIQVYIYGCIYTSVPSSPPLSPDLQTNPHPAPPK